MPDLLAAQAALRSTFGFADFRPGQRAIIEAVLGGADEQNTPANGSAGLVIGLVSRIALMSVSALMSSRYRSAKMLLISP
jgi:hypothetical protein